MSSASLARVLVALALGPVALLAGACGSSHETIRLGNADSGSAVTAAQGDTLEVTLQTIGPGHYGTPEISSPSVAFVGEAPVTRPNPGGPTQRFRFEASSTGRATITISHSVQNRVFTLMVTVS
jgi:endonuclease YncB( thermonuclease family)